MGTSCARDSARRVAFGPLLTARTEASVEAALPFWQEQPETFEAILAAAEAMLELDERSLPFRQPGTLEAILAVEVEQGCVDEDDQDEVLRQWRRSSLPSFDPRNVDVWNLDGDGSPRGSAGRRASPVHTGDAVARAARERSEQERETPRPDATGLHLPAHPLSTDEIEVMREWWEADRQWREPQ